MTWRFTVKTITEPRIQLHACYTTEMEFIFTTKPDFKDGIRLPADVYNAIKNEMIELLDNEEGVPLPSFFEILHIRFAELLGEDENVGWYLYHVKLDLQTRGLINVEYPKEGRTIKAVIKIVRAQKRRGPTIL